MDKRNWEANGKEVVDMLARVRDEEDARLDLVNNPHAVIDILIVFLQECQLIIPRQLKESESNEHYWTGSSRNGST